MLIMKKETQEFRPWNRNKDLNTTRVKGVSNGHASSTCISKQEYKSGLKSVTI